MTTMQQHRRRAPTVPDELTEAVWPLRAPVVITHVVPDADALGSMLAMCLALSTEGRRPKASVPEGSLSQRLSFLLDLSGAAVAAAEDFTSADGFIIVDTAKKSRCNVPPVLKKTEWSSGRPTVNIDHHATNTRFGDVNWVVETAGSTCELIYHLLRAADGPMSPVIASMLYAGIQTDTLGFSLPTTTASALRASAQLVECGADVAELGERLNRSLRRSEFDLLRAVYANTRIVGEGRIAYSSASYEEIHGAGCTAADIDDQITVPRSLDGVQLAILFSEGRRGRTRINFRGSGRVTVVELAAQFGGGGHSQAAGAILDCGLEEALKAVVPKAIEYIERFPADG